MMSCQRCSPCRPAANDAEWCCCCYDTLHTQLPGPGTADHAGDDDDDDDAGDADDHDDHDADEKVGDGGAVRPS